MALRIIDACGGSVKGKELAILGLSFKPNTDDVRESPALEIVEGLLDEGAILGNYDPEAMHEARKIIGERVTYAKGAYEAIDGAAAVVLVTELNEFRSLDLTKIKAMLKNNLVIDLRNIYKPEEMQAQNINYISYLKKNHASKVSHYARNL